MLHLSMPKKSKHHSNRTAGSLLSVFKNKSQFENLRVSSGDSQPWLRLHLESKTIARTSNTGATLSPSDRDKLDDGVFKGWTLGYFNNTLVF